MRKRNLLVASSVIAAIITVSILPATALAQEEVTQRTLFSRDVQPLLQGKLAALLADQQGLQLDSWERLIAGSHLGSVILPFDADNSLLIDLASRPEANLSEDERALLRRWIDEGARNDAGDVPYADADQLLYVCHQDGASISVVDMERNVIIRIIDLQELGFSEHARPHHIAVEPDGSHWYVSLIGENRVLKFNRADEIVGQAIFEVPGMLALDPTSNLLYVGRSMSAVNPPQSIGVIDRTDMSIEELDVFFPRPHALVVDPRTSLAYSGSMTVDQIATINGETMDVELSTIESNIAHSAHAGMGHGNMFVQFAIAPDSPILVVGGEMTGQVLFIDLSDPVAPALTGTVAVNAKPWDPVYTPDGRYIYLGNNGANTVTVLDAAEREVVDVISGEGLSEPYGSAIRPDGRYVYISNSNLQGAYTPRRAAGHPSEVGTLAVIDTETRRIVKILEVGKNPTGIGTRRVY